MRVRPLVIQVTGDSGSGKTLVVERAVRRLRRRHLRVAVVKHSHHAPDLAGKDTARSLRAGAEWVVFSGARSFLLLRSAPSALVRVLPVDVVLVEGYSARRIGDVRIHLRSPADVGPSLARLLEAAPRAPSRPTVTVDGRRRPAEGLWRLVGNLLEFEHAAEVRRP